MRVRTLIAAFCLLLAGPAGFAAEAPFGGKSSVRFAEKLWQALQGRGLVGEGAINSKPSRGQHPHGAVLDPIEGKLIVAGRAGVVIVKRNYGGEGVSVSEVADNPDRWLKAVTVMFRRESGYDPENRDWFWAKYAPDGRLEKNANGVWLAGRVAKGSPKGCIACHRSARGDDLVFNNDRHR